MALETADSAFIGTDFQRVFQVLNEDEDAAIDIAGWSLSWMLKRRLSMLDADASVTKTTGGGTVAISGTYNADPTVNTQRATVTITDTDTESLTAAVYYYELKRMDAGLETVIAYGEFELIRGVHRA
jgi:hypothetical protein